MIGEGKRLHKLGFGIHWLKANSKAPLESGWTKGDRKTWQELEDSYRYGLNIGVRLGRVSKFKDGTYLAVVDCDVKSEDPKHEIEMLRKLTELLGKENVGPQVSSGRGNGSRHIYIRTKEPVQPYRFTQSPHKVRVLMPSVKPSRYEEQNLKQADLNEGWRLRAAWEISIMGEGQQVVLPPSIHPDTGGTYEWAVPVESWKDIPLVKIGGAKVDKPATVVEDFKAVDVDLVGSELPDGTVDMIVSGEGCQDRSAALFTVTIAMVKARFTDNEILSVLTDKDNFLGQAAFDHANTTSRKRAAQWLSRYTLAKVKSELSAAKLFSQDVQVSEETRAEMEEHALGLPHTKSEEWLSRLEREGGKPEGRPKPTLKNITVILKEAVDPQVFRFDSFALRTTYGCETPWGAKPDDVFRDVDAAKIKHWLSVHYRVEPSVQLVWEAMQVIAEENLFHPIQTYLRGLPPWDGKERIAGWLKRHFHAHGPDYYLDEVLLQWMVAAVRRVFEPGAKFDWMLILEGNQDIGKSSFVQILASSKYFIDRLGDLGDKDAAQVLQGIWLVEMGELKELKRNEIETVKGFITRQVDKYRPSYGRASIEAPRQCVFAGSTNADKYLKDDTGNRRFIPVSLRGSLDFAQLEKDRDMLWAEALAIYDSGFGPNGVLSPESKAYAKKCHSMRMTEDDSDVMLEHILDFIDEQKKKPEKERFRFERFKLLELFSDFGPLTQWKPGGWTVQLAGRALKKIGATQIRAQGRFWWKLPKTPTPHPSPSPASRNKKERENGF